MSDSPERLNINNVGQTVDTLLSIEDDDREAVQVTAMAATIYVIRKHAHDVLADREAYVNAVSALSTLMVALDRGSAR